MALSLAHLAASDRHVARPTVVMAVLEYALSFLAGWLVVRRELRPFAVLTDTASSSAQSRICLRRAAVGAPRDELGRLPTTFSEMLASLQQACFGQQGLVADASHERRVPITLVQASLEPLAPSSDVGPAAEADTPRAGRAGPAPDKRARRGTASRTRPPARDRLDLQPVAVQGDPDRLTQLLLIPLDDALYCTPGAGASA